MCLRVAVCIYQSVSMFILYPQHRKSSHPALSHHVHGCLLCPGEGCIRLRVGVIGIKPALVKSHQRLEMLSETGNLLLGGFLQLPDSVCHCLPYCLSLYPSLLKSLITAQFPSALFLSHLLSFDIYYLSLVLLPSILLALSLSLSLSLICIVFRSDVCP